jgi:hypothetical protein
MTRETKEQRRRRWENALKNVEFPEDVDTVIKTAFDNYKGDLTVLESAIGAMFLGFMIGWKPIVIIHSPRTVKRYEQILGVKFKGFLPDKTDMSDRSKGYEVARMLDNFWHGVSGNAPVTDRKIAVGLDGQTE